MIRFRLTFVVPLALVAVSGSAAAQHAHGGMATPSAHTARTAPTSAAQSTGGAWTGKASKWGGSPPQSSASPQARAYAVPSAYLLDGVASPAYPPSAPAPYVTDTVNTAATVRAASASSSVAAQEQRQLTTMEVYRQQRFGKP